jgi:hypothetical protein
MKNMIKCAVAAVLLSTVSAFAGTPLPIPTHNNVLWNGTDISDDEVASQVIGWYRPNGFLIAEIKLDGTVSFGVDVTPQEAADWVASNLSYNNRFCKGKLTPEYSLFISRVYSLEFSIKIKPDGLVEYTNFTPTQEEAQFYQLVADHISCDPSPREVLRRGGISIGSGLQLVPSLKTQQK